ncbi:MAG: S41 family peptidase [Bacteroidota bacterium]
MLLKKKYLPILLIFSFVFFINCSSDDPDPDPIVNVELKNEINDFVWKGMNSAYYWQENVPNLDDTKDDDLNAYHTYLNSKSEPESLFESLLFDKGNTDRFSWFIDDYNEQNASFRGVSDSFGFDFGLARLCEDCNEVIGFITYVVPNSPAADTNMKRGDIFYKFNGTVLDLNNYTIVNAYYTDDNITMDFATIENGNITPNDVNVSLTIREVIENPVFYSDIINNSQGTKVGYLVYNGFKYTFHEELNNIFSEFKSENIQELILDLRYNGGGSVLTSAYLASMIHAGASPNEIFAKLVHNSKMSSENGNYSFFNNARVYDKDGDYSGNDISINRLNNLDKVYVITSGGTASASEMVINGLSPYMSVITVGETTYGKNVGSYTVYDSPDFTSNNVNSNHTNAMQPITFKIFNKLDQSDYTHGFTPDYEVVEYASEMKPFGDLEEPLLKATLDIISGTSAKIGLLKEPEFGGRFFFNSLDKKPFSKEMYIIPQERSTNF